MIGAGGGVVWFLLRGLEWAVAAIVGALISAFLTLFFAVRFFLRSRGLAPRQVTGVLYRTQTLKFLLAVVLLSGATYQFGMSAVALVTTFSATLVAYWVALLWLHH